jgi:hypothetical protein
MVMNFKLDIKPINQETDGDRLKSNFNLEYRLLQSKAEIADYERALYREFTKKNPHNWLCRNYLLIENNRYRSPISYSTQSVYGMYQREKLKSAVAINFDTNSQMQFEAVGFSFNKESVDGDFCEVLTFFICQDDNFNANYFRLIACFKQFVVTDLRNKNISFGLANCTSNFLPLYLKTGWSITSTKTIEGVDKYLIKYNIASQ